MYDMMRNMTKTDKILQVGEDCPYVQSGYTQARLFVKGDNIEIEGPSGIYTKKNWDCRTSYNMAIYLYNQPMRQP